MGSKKFTFIELHLDGDTQIGPKSIDDALPAGTKVDVEAEEETESEAEESGGKGAIGAVVGLVLLVAVAVAVQKFRGEDDEPELDVHEEPDVVVN
ncbi:hypothetical protein [Natrononativus amylolyticus]|uniref:hypothetical protein n=1 Tax=Natrononativus amylolyticus TaxID=2963434 RepID=UPI0020CED3E7|nr:hypothetical protein [Natrononativus amylolyticus]